jgi:Uma2 family endonuclease
MWASAARRGSGQDPYPTKPMFLCIEILSPEDRFSEVLAKCDGYLAWGVPMTWIVDSELHRALQYAAAGRNSPCRLPNCFPFSIT